ncbi:hypothetical protein LIER_31308 [Lithospermum erythrorhizon]|uniref:Uncharacterized protein n=1 Tax=Lithospermum erythrorhizon TaxID=34254 RepID=A0AAV3RVX2_LITER
MSHSSENQTDNYELRACTNPNHTETSRMGEMTQFPIVDPPTEEPNQSVVPMIQGPRNPANLAVAARADYQGIMDSLPTLIRSSMPSTITDDNLDGFATYFSIPPDKVEARLALPGDQLILPRIDVGTSDLTLPQGIQQYMQKPFPLACTCPFSNFVNNLLIIINRTPDQFKSHKWVVECGHV